MEPVPGPRPWPLIGNLLDIDVNNSIQSYMGLVEKWGPIFKLSLAGTDRIFISSQELVNEICTRKEFIKHITGSLAHLHKVVPDGLFTANTAQGSWGQVRRTLNPTFTPTSLRSMFPEMLDIASQLVLKWARHGPHESIDLSVDLVKLTLDTLALTAMGTRFNSLYHDDFHPFVQRFGAMFAECQRRSSRPAWITWLQWSANRTFDENNAWIRAFCADVLSQRRAREAEGDEPGDRNDVFTAMLHRRDPVTGKQLADPAIIDNMMTFLFAGHDTTASLLSFLVYHLIKNPGACAKLKEEIDCVLGGGGMTVDHLNQLPYLKACLRETLRLDPPAQAFPVTPSADHGDKPVKFGGGRYAVRHGETVFALLPALHRDKAVWGDDADVFRPERMSEEAFAKLPRNAWLPFGYGVRKCIGQDFAMQEATIAAALLFQNFDLALVNQDYTLQYQPSLNRRAKNLLVHARLRPGVDVLSLQRDLLSRKKGT